MFYLILFLFIFLEGLIGVGYLFPGTLLLVLAGAGVSQFFFNFWIIFFVATFANLLGSSLNYFLGLKAGKKVLKEGFFFLKPAYFKRGIEFVEKYKGRFLLLGKQIPGVKEIITFLAGVFHLPFDKFIVWNILGALIWFWTNFLIGYIFGYSFSSAIRWMDKFHALVTYFIIFIILFMVLRYFLIKFGKKTYLFLKQFFIWLSGFLPNHIQRFFIKFSVFKAFFLLIIFSITYLFLAYIGFVKIWYSNNLVKHIDISVSNLMAYYYDYYFEKIALFLSFWGNLTTIIILFLLWILFLKKGDNIRFIRGISGYSFVFLLIFLTKLITARHRPMLSLYTELSYSFPSFHAGISMFFYGLLALYFASKQKYWDNKINIIVLALFFIFLVGLSRIYLNVHYFSDVVGGYWIGFVILILVMLIRK